MTHSFLDIMFDGRVSAIETLALEQLARLLQLTQYTRFATHFRFIGDHERLVELRRVIEMRDWRAEEFRQHWEQHPEAQALLANMRRWDTFHEHMTNIADKISEITIGN